MMFYVRSCFCKFECQTYCICSCLCMLSFACLRLCAIKRLLCVAPGSSLLLIKRGTVSNPMTPSTSTLLLLAATFARVVHGTNITGVLNVSNMSSLAHGSTAPDASANSSTLSLQKHLRVARGSSTIRVINGCNREAIWIAHCCDWWNFGVSFYIYIYISFYVPQESWDLKTGWFGDPRPLLCTSKPLYKRVQWFLGCFFPTLFLLFACVSNVAILSSSHLSQKLPHNLKQVKPLIPSLAYCI